MSVVEIPLERLNLAVGIVKLTEGYIQSLLYTNNESIETLTKIERLLDELKELQKLGDEKKRARCQ